MFGRRKLQDDPFASLRDGSTYQSTPTTLPDLGVSGLGADPGTASTQPLAPSATPTSAPPPTPTLRPMRTAAPGFVLTPGASRRRQRFGGGGLEIWIVVRLVSVLIVLVVVAIPVIGAVKAVHSATNLPSFNPGTGAGAAPSATVAKPASYLKPAGLRAGLTQIAKLAPGARLVDLRIDANSLSATAILPNRSAKEIYLGPNGTFVTSVPAPDLLRGVTITQIRPNVVGRLVAEMGRRFHVALSRIDYMVVTSAPGLGARWLVFSKAPSHPGFSATLRGANLAPLP
jgi:hypothetical protein